MGRPSVAAASMRGRSQLRHRWRSWLALAVLVGIVGGLLIGAAAGARRTASVYNRLAEKSGRLDYGIFARPLASELPCGDDALSVEVASACRDESEAALRTVLHSPLVADGFVVTTMLLPVFTADGRSLQPEEGGDDPCFTGTGEVNIDSFGSGGPAINRPVYVTGRAPREFDEVAVSKAVADRRHLSVGDHLRIVPVGACDGLSRSDWPSPITVRIVGTQLSPIEVEPESGFFLQSVAVTPPLLRRLESRGLGSPNAAVRLREGASIRDLVGAAEENGIAIDVAIEGDAFEAGVEDGLSPDVTTLFVLVALGAAASAIVLGQAIVRQAQAESVDFEVLRAMGFTNRDLAAAGAIEGAALGVVGAIMCVLIAAALSLFTPIGRARGIEPDPGLRFDALPMAGGAALLALVCVFAVVGASWLVARRGLARWTVASKPSLAASWTRRARLAPPAAYGVRMALEPGREPGRAPIRSGLVGMVAALAALAGSLTFVAGLDHLLATPRLVGMNWDVMYFLEDRPRAIGKPRRSARCSTERERSTACRRSEWQRSSGRPMHR